nr:hypothetical protein CFP56_22541 [Quercus suber]
MISSSVQVDQCRHDFEWNHHDGVTGSTQGMHSIGSLPVYQFCPLTLLGTVQHVHVEDRRRDGPEDTPDFVSLLEKHITRKLDLHIHCGLRFFPASSTTTVYKLGDLAISEGKLRDHVVVLWPLLPLPADTNSIQQEKELADTQGNKQKQFPGFGNAVKERRPRALKLHVQ